MKCGKHAKGTAQEISEYCLEHMCEVELNDSRCNDCTYKEDKKIAHPSPPPPPSSKQSSFAQHNETSLNPVN